jgi:hypothetical protein
VLSVNCENLEVEEGDGREKWPTKLKKGDLSRSLKSINLYAIGSDKIRGLGCGFMWGGVVDDARTGRWIVSVTVVSEH